MVGHFTSLPRSTFRMSKADDILEMVLLTPITVLDNTGGGSSWLLLWACLVQALVLWAWIVRSWDSVLGSRELGILRCGDPAGLGSHKGSAGHLVEFGREVCPDSLARIPSLNNRLSKYRKHLRKGCLLSGSELSDFAASLKRQ
jgi:hypothetical protein